ncbi:MAG: DUF4296 domain-containing protein [Bacteroidales bacterium]
MKRTIVTILFLALIMGLGCKKNKKIIPRDEMVSVLVKIHLMDGAMEISQYNPEIDLPDTMDFYKVVLEDYDYTRAQFDSSLQYYSKDLRKFDRIYQEVLSRLNKMETAAQERNQDPPGKHEKDSPRKAEKGRESPKE